MKKGKKVVSFAIVSLLVLSMIVATSNVFALPTNPIADILDTVKKIAIALNYTIGYLDGTIKPELDDINAKIDAMNDGGSGGAYAFIYTTGPFTLPANTHSLNWNLLNNDDTPQKVRVTVFKCPILSEKTVEPPGPLEFTLAPNETTHNANIAMGGWDYEIQVETNSKLVFPSAEAWPSTIGDVIPGSEVRAAEFIRRMP